MTLENAEIATYGAVAATPDEMTERSLWQAIGRGFLCKCPNCGAGKLFNGYLRSVHRCAACDEEFRHHRADDLPPYLTVFIVGHLVVGLFMAVEEVGNLSLGAHLAIWIPITVVLSLGLLRPFKGATIGLQWAMRMHGFGSAADGSNH